MPRAVKIQYRGAHYHARSYEKYQISRADPFFRKVNPVTGADADQLKYYGNASNTVNQNATLSQFLVAADGRCVHWVEFLQQVYKIQGVDVTIITVFKDENHGIKIKDNLSGQGGVPFQKGFFNHAFLRFNNETKDYLLDPSYGIIYKKDSLDENIAEWEKQSVEYIENVNTHEKIYIGNNDVKDLNHTEE